MRKKLEKQSLLLFIALIVLTIVLGIVTFFYIDGEIYYNSLQHELYDLRDSDNKYNPSKRKIYDGETYNLTLVENVTHYRSIWNNIIIDENEFSFSNNAEEATIVVHNAENGEVEKTFVLKDYVQWDDQEESDNIDAYNKHNMTLVINSWDSKFIKLNNKLFLSLQVDHHKYRWKVITVIIDLTSLKITGAYGTCGESSEDISAAEYNKGMVYHSVNNYRYSDGKKILSIERYDLVGDKRIISKEILYTDYNISSLVRVRDRSYNSGDIAIATILDVNGEYHYMVLDFGLKPKEAITENDIYGFWIDSDYSNEEKLFDKERYLLLEDKTFIWVTATQDRRDGLIAETGSWSIEQGELALIAKEKLYEDGSLPNIKNIILNDSKFQHIIFQPCDYKKISISLYDDGIYRSIEENEEDYDNYAIHFDNKEFHKNIKNKDIILAQASFEEFALMEEENPRKYSGNSENPQTGA